MAATMTPLEFAQKYFGLEAFIFPQETEGTGKPAYVPPQGWRRLRVDNYRLGASAWEHVFWKDIAPHFNKPVTVKVKTISGAIEDHVFRHAKQAWPHFHYPFVGKGSPEQAQIAIQLVYRFRKVTTTLEHFVEQNFIGLDCNGFVGNYIQRVVKGAHWLAQDNSADPGPTTLISGLVDAQGRVNQINGMDDFCPDGTYLFGWCNPNGSIKDPSKDQPTSYGHVMITEPWTLKKVPGGLSVGVVEATAAGKRKLRSLDYTIQSATKAHFGTVFRVLRGSASDPMDVRIAQLNA